MTFHGEARTTFTRTDIERDLRELGLREGDWVMVHSSLSSIGYVERGAETLIAALENVVTPDGLLMMPTFTYESAAFEVNKTPAVTGKVPEVFRRQPGVIRSLHPTHSVAAWGREAARVVKGHEWTTPFAPDSPLGKLIGRGGWILLIGVSHTVNSAIHMAEYIARVPYSMPGTAEVVTASGEIATVEIAWRPGCSQGFGKIEPYLEHKGLIRRGRVGQAECQLVLGKGVVETGVERLRKDPGALLCDRTECWWCSRAKVIIKNLRNWP